MTMANPLFREFDRYAREQVRAEFRRSEGYKLVQEVRRAMNTPRRVTSTASQFGDMIQRYSRHGISAGTLRAASRVPFGDMVREVIQYQASGGEGARLIGQLLGQLGPMGRLLKSLIGPSGNRIRGSGIEAELNAATELLRAFAPERLAPQWRSATTTGQVADSLEAAIARLESEGYEVTGPGLPKPMKEAPPTLFPRGLPRVTPTPQRPGKVDVTKPLAPGRVRPQPQRPRRPAPDDPLTTAEQPFLPDAIPKTTQAGTDRIQVELEGRRFPSSHPVVTKEMVLVVSSNVHSIGYDYDSQTLYVRYQADKASMSAGSLYAYSAVSLQQFLALFDAPSKGVWIWDNVRIRGTWSGHRHDYRLVAIRNNYVPRKATYVGGGREKFIPRTVRVQSKKRGTRTLTSALPEAYAPDLSVYGEPNRGEPNRGEPNRGR